MNKEAANDFRKYGYAKTILKEIIKKCVKFGDFTLSSGKKSDFYVNCKEIMLSLDFMHYFSMYVREEFKEVNYGEPNFCSHAIGMTSGADPMICALIALNYFSGSFVRKQQKEHGMKSRIDGKFEKGTRCLVVDDVLTTGNSIIEVDKVAIDAGLVPRIVLVLVDRQENDAKKRVVEETGLNVVSIFKRDDFIK